MKLVVEDITVTVEDDRYKAVLVDSETWTRCGDLREALEKFIETNKRLSLTVKLDNNIEMRAYWLRDQPLWQENIVNEALRNGYKYLDLTIKEGDKVRLLEPSGFLKKNAIVKVLQVNAGCATIVYDTNDVHVSAYVEVYRLEKL